MTEAIKSGVEAGLGIGIVARWAIRKELELGTLRTIAVRGLRLAAKPEEREPIPWRAGSLAHGGTQGTVDLAVVLEAFLPNANDDIYSPVASHQCSCRST
jgi:DNA-binding transcriptional LysR family regulator